MAVEVLFHYVHRCRFHDMSSFSHVSKRTTGPSLLTPYIYERWTENHVFNVMNTASATPTYPGCFGTTCARITMQKYARHAA